MKSRQTTLLPFFPWFAAVTLLAWIGAQVLCQAHCSPGACHDESGEAGCHKAATSHSHHGDEKSPDHQESSADASCETLKSALSGNVPSPVIIPEFSLLYTLARIALDATAIESGALFSRDARTRDWVFTPKVCLGPAFRSLAPPVLL